ncbi:FKBP12-associated protein [Coemansia aciculifera]|nr:FKBP12-associated protein [Coemansia aciculifera]
MALDNAAGDGDDPAAAKGKRKGKSRRGKERNEAPRSGNSSRNGNNPRSGNSSRNGNNPRSGNNSRAGKGVRMARIDDEAEPSRNQQGNRQTRRGGGGRAFSGRLTVEDAVDDSDAEARRAETSNLSSVLGKRLLCGDYECMICCDKVRGRHSVWQCDCCWAIFHLACVRRWAQSCVADNNSGSSGAQWRCPGCQHARSALPAHYMCFCGATLNPEPVRGTVPHACGGICGRRRGAHCPHACAQTCHPGPCAPCTALAPEQRCFCGRVAHQPRCGASFDPALAARSCGAPCGEILGCGKHRCAAACHAGLCAPCGETAEVRCVCGRHTRAVACGDDRPVVCGEVCGAVLGCGKHRCERTCHAPGDAHACALDPATVATCHCGAQPAARAACTDPVPSCGAPCGRALGCGHACAGPCHAGACPPCREPVDARCACGASVVRAECRAGPPRCQRVCGRKRACGRHKCAERCCADAAHACPLVCGRSLRCRAHACGEPCHRGECRPCGHVGLDALSCACGLTRVEPPVACGAVVPPCRHPCRRARACGHVSIASHECHGGACPPCAVLVSAPCMCGAREMRAVPCHRSQSASCGEPCGRLLACGGHRCQRTCHRGDEPCGLGEPCRQVCGKPRRSCGHACALKCHSPTMCDESQPCVAMVRAACACGRLSAERRCEGARTPSQALACDDVCRIAERNRRVALAFGLPERAEQPLAGLVRATYPGELLDFARTNTSWVRGIENLAAAFIGDARRRTLRFVSMKHALRDFLHELAPFYGCASRSVDYEPNRSVCWDRGPHSTIPSIILSSAIRYAHAPQIVCSLLAKQEGEEEEDEEERTTPPSILPADAIDYIAISDLRHGLTADELAAVIRKLFPGAAPFTVRWKDEDLVEVYCSDSANKHEHLSKWLAVLKKRLPHLGVAGLVVPCQQKASSPPPPPPPIKSPFLAAKEPKTRSWADDDDDDDDDGIPDNWEALNISDNE